MWLWSLPILALVLVAAWWVHRRRSRPSAAVLDHQLEVALKSVGPGRCEAAIDLLYGLARRGDEGLIERSWERLELPLLEAVPDCPPHRKSDLMRALEACHGLVRRRDLQRRLIDMRNGLASGTDEYVIKPE
jgi:hypothetical protein